ncbi:hypothetical protein NPS46_02900 [Pseudomonas putida]|uniref:hypothetical protein n=1 Tax=Pseudomonas putida TaxID=303 RepID=UPI0023639B55|nr:hypothetical protein [Pseudomonas putida]MDD2051495.1 hypothetical protein [Pseudomonas putida]
MASIVFEGSWYDRSISDAEFAAIKDAKDIRDVTSVWGRIQDWFCGTRKEEAKQALFIFLNEEREGSERLAAFNMLYKQVAGPYKDNFDCKILEGSQLAVSITCGSEAFTLEQPFQGELFIERNAIVKKIDEGLTNDLAKGETPDEQFKKDVPRQTCSFCGDGYDLSYKVNDGKVNKLEEVGRFLNGCKSAYQKNILQILVSQSGIAELLDYKVKKDKEDNKAKNVPPDGSGRLYNMDVRKLPSGDMRVDIVFENSLTSELLRIDQEAKAQGEEFLRGEYYKSVQVEASFVIGSEHTVCLNAEYSFMDME